MRSSRPASSTVYASLICGCSMKAMADCIVHIGYHKTGSTWLRRQVFPGVQGATFARGPIFFALMRNLTEEDNFYDSTFRAAVAETGERVLLSYESLASGHPFDPTIDPDRIADRLVALAPDARIVLFTREREALARSVYAHYVQVGGCVSRERFEETKLARGYLDIDAAVERYRSRFEHVLVLPYEQLRADRNECIARIESFADVRFVITGETRRENVSVYGWRLAVLREWNRVFRSSAYHPNPPLPLAGAATMRKVLQRSVSRA